MGRGAKRLESSSIDHREFWIQLTISGVNHGGKISVHQVIYRFTDSGCYISMLTIAIVVYLQLEVHLIKKLQKSLTT